MSNHKKIKLAGMSLLLILTVAGYFKWNNMAATKMHVQKPQLNSHGLPEQSYKNVLLYTKSHCPYCTRTKQLLKNLGVEFKNIEISYDDALRQEMIERSGRKTVPQVFICDEHIGGWDDLSKLFQDGHLLPKLKNSYSNPTCGNL